MADGSENPGIATDLTRQASQHAHTVASWLEDREPGQVLDEVERGDLVGELPAVFEAVPHAIEVFAPAS